MSAHRSGGSGQSGLRQGGLSQYVVAATHDAMELKLPLAPPPPLPFWAAVVSAVGTAPITLLVVALPAALFIEDQGWWLVNKHVLAERWLTAGTWVAIGLTLVFALVRSRPGVVRIRIERGRMVLHRRWRPIRVVLLQELVRVGVSSQKLHLVRREGPSEAIALPLKEPNLLLELSRLLTDLAATSGTPEAIPPGLQALRERRRSGAISG